MNALPFTAAAHKDAVDQLRRMIADIPEPEYMVVARAEIRQMHTSTILGFMDNPKLLGPIMANWLGDSPTDDDMDVLGVRMGMALADEIDRRIPVPTRYAMANELATQAETLRQCDPDDTVKDCERRIDKLCSIVEALALLVRGAP